MGGTSRTPSENRRVRHPFSFVRGLSELGYNVFRRGRGGVESSGLRVERGPAMGDTSRTLHKKT